MEALEPSNLTRNPAESYTLLHRKAEVAQFNIPRTVVFLILRQPKPRLRRCRMPDVFDLRHFNSNNTWSTLTTIVGRYYR